MREPVATRDADDLLEGFFVPPMPLVNPDSISSISGSIGNQDASGYLSFPSVAIEVQNTNTSGSSSTSDSESSGSVSSDDVDVDKYL